MRTQTRRQEAQGPLQLALEYLERGWTPVPISKQMKKPIGAEWQKVRITAENAVAYFKGDINVGVQLGPCSGGLTDVDLDCPEAVAVGSLLLPATTATFGRPSKPKSHRLYVTSLADKITKAALQFKDTDGKMLLELRIGGGGKGAQSVFPGSMHASGEDIVWYDDGEPTPIDGDELLRAVQRLAVVVLLVRHWPAAGGRHDASLTVGGFLARAGLDEDTAATMVEAISKAAGDTEWADRVQAARDAVAEHADGGPSRGFPKLVEAFGLEVARKAAKWTGYNDEDATLSKLNAEHAVLPIGGKTRGNLG